MKIAYFDCFSGISGDMTLSALLDACPTVRRAGVPFSQLNAILKKVVAPHRVSLSLERVDRCGLSGAKINIKGADKYISLNEMSRLIKKVPAIDDVRTNSLKILNRLVSAESKVHCKQHSKDTRFHELGSIDTVIDIVGSVWLLHYLGVKKVFASALPLTEGKIKVAHGIYPLPAPATMEMLKGFELFKSNIKAELVTPTGAAILTTLARPSKEMPSCNFSAIGYGAGTLNIPSQPNILRVFIGETTHSVISGKDDTETDNIAVLETNIDNVSPEVIGYVVDGLFSAGALDVFTVPIQMKKSRPAILLKVLSPIDLVSRMEKTIFTEIPTLGIRKYFVSRTKLKRTVYKVKTKYGIIRVKTSRYGAKKNISPEYDDCQRLAKMHKVPIGEIISEARKKTIVLEQ